MTTDTHSEIMRAIGRLEGKVDGINQRLDTLNGSQTRQDEKINALESFRDQVAGKVAVIGVVGAVVGTAIVGFFKKKIGL